jgi:OOP family OmpA-OmpF porin
MNKLHAQFLHTKVIKSFAAILFASSISIPIASQAADEPSLGYQYDSQGNVLRDAKGNCFRSSLWSPTNAIAACDPRVVKQRTEEVPVREKKGKLVSEAGVTEINTDVDIIVLVAGKGFDFNSAEISSAGKQRIAEYMSRHTDDYIHRVYLDGYTDEIGDKDYNLGLSQRRAEAVKAQLVAHGIPQERIIVSAHGSTNPIVTCPDTTGDALVKCLAPNRRTEAKVVIPVVRTAVSAEFVERRRQDEIKDSNVKAEAVAVNSSLIDEGYNKAVKIIGEGCSREVATICGDIPLGQGKILDCLKSNDSNLSSTCRQSIAQGESTIQVALGNANYFGARCGPEIARHCSDITPGDGRIVACLEKNNMNLEKRCYDAMNELDLM